MDQAKDGIVMISFGTVINISQILPNINDGLISIFKKFPEVCVDSFNVKKIVCLLFSYFLSFSNINISRMI